MKFLANENFPLKSVIFLKEHGLDIISIGGEVAGISDNEVMEIAIAEDRTILTFDSDYGELIFKYNYKPPQGVVYFRIQEYAPEEPGKILLDLLNEDKLSFASALTVYDSNSVRQRKY